MHEIKITEIENIKIGQVENTEAATGCTVLICEQGMPAGLDVRGGGPSSRESELLKPLAAASAIHAIVLSGGSSYGLNAGGGVMQYLEEHDIGLDTGICKVPLVCQSDLYDLTVGDHRIRPDKDMGYQAARAALEGGNYKDGNYGAGCGASVGKWNGMDTCMKAGIGSYAIQIGDLKIGAIVAVNALGDIYDWKTGQKVAGLLTEDKTAFLDTVEMMLRRTDVIENKFVKDSDNISDSNCENPSDDSIKSKLMGNTTLGVIITNAAFNKSSLCKIAGMAHNGYARSIRPVNTSADGDSIYAVSTGNVSADQDLVGTLAADVMSEAILRAVKNCRSAYGLLSAADL